MMRQQFSLHQITIAGSSFRVRSNLNLEDLNALVDLVQKRIDDALSVTKTGSLQNAVILAALQLAESYWLERQKNQRLQQMIQEHKDEVLQEIQEIRQEAIRWVNQLETQP